jgi:YNFM family putative membrane transporter
LPVSSTPSTGDPIPTRAIAVLALASFASAANLRVCDPLLPQMAAELGVTIGGAAMVVMSFALAYGVFQILVGPLGDARGKLALVVLGSLWAGAATILSAAMPSLGPLALVRFLAGAGAAAVIPVAIAWIGDVVPTSGASRCWHGFFPGRSWGSCSARRQAACSAS